MKKYLSGCTSKHNSLKIAWCSSDLAYHPVCRFIYSIFAKSGDLRHEHIVVDTFDHEGETRRGLFDQLEHISVFNPSSRSELEKLSAYKL